MAEQDLNGAQVGAGFKKMGREAVPGSGLFRVTEDPINERRVSTLRGRICWCSRPA